MRQEIAGLGLAKPAYPKSMRDVLSYRVIVPEGVQADFRIVYTLDDRKEEKPDWAEHPGLDEHLFESTSAFFDFPVRAVTVELFRLEGGSIFVNFLQAE